MVFIYRKRAIARRIRRRNTARSTKTRSTYSTAKRYVRSNPKTVSKRMTSYSQGKAVIPSKSAQSVWPTKKYVTLRYCDSDQITMPPSPLGNHPNNYHVTYKANGCYDPQDALGGHQPQGWDAWAGIYDHYRVLRSRCTAQFTPYPNSPGTPAEVCLVGLRVTDTIPASPTTNPSPFEDASCNWTTLKSTSEAVTLSASFDQFAFFGPNRQALTASTAGDPTELAHFDFFAMRSWFTGTDPVFANPFYVDVNYSIEYDIEFSEPKLTATFN